MRTLDSFRPGGLLLTRRPGERVVPQDGGRVIAVLQLVETDTRGRAMLQFLGSPQIRVDREEIFWRSGPAAGAAGGTRG